MRATTCWAYSTYILGPKFKDTLTELGATYLNYKDDNYARYLISLSGKLLVGCHASLTTWLNDSLCARV